MALSVEANSTDVLATNTRKKDVGAGIHPRLRGSLEAPPEPCECGEIDSIADGHQQVDILRAWLLGQQRTKERNPIYPGNLAGGADKLARERQECPPDLQ